MLEMVVALAIFGIALAGFCPHVVMHVKHLRKLEERIDPQATHFLVPPTDHWSRKLGAPAMLSSVDPGTVPPLPDEPQPNRVEIVSLDKSLVEEVVTVHVIVEANSP